MLGKSCSNRCRVCGDWAGSISRTGGATSCGHGTGSGGTEGVAQPARKITATSIRGRQSCSKSTLHLLRHGALPLELLL